MTDQEPSPRATKARDSRPNEDTPLIRQYLQIKAEHPDHVLFFRCGDFYEMFFDDARKSAEVLGITLTSRGTDSRGEPVPLAGVPYHAVEQYLARMIRAGHRVALCEQTEDPKNAKGVVKREVVRVVTPGTVLEDHLLDIRAPNYLAAIVVQGQALGLAALEFSTGQFETWEFHGARAPEDCGGELSRLGPAEIVVARADLATLQPTGLLDELALESYSAQSSEARGGAVSILVPVDGEISATYARELVTEQMGTKDLSGFGLEDAPTAVAAAAVLLRYLRSTQQAALLHVNSMRLNRPGRLMTLDPTTQRSLELVSNLSDSTRRHTLLDTIDFTSTAMGARMLREWVLAPLRDPIEINHRLDAVEVLRTTPDVADALGEALRNIRDLERLLARVVCRTSTPRDLAGLRASLRLVPDVRAACSQLATAAPLLGALGAAMDPEEPLVDLLVKGLVDQPPPNHREGGLVEAGFDPALDELRTLSTDSKSWIAELRQAEIARTGISTLKVGFNRVFGYYLEVTQSHAAKVPDDWIRKQTLANAERYVTPELKAKEEVILHAEERANDLEAEWFEKFRAAVAERTRTIQATARAIAAADVLLSLARAAVRRRYTRPTFVETDPRPRAEAPADEPHTTPTRENCLLIRDGRHPVLETIQRERSFVPNDTLLSGRDSQLLLITGPNMAGKSTFIRQVALIALMAHMGSFVPASECVLTPVDRLFTRVGAMDQIAKGQSTFLVEMTETANILNNATSDSLVILDEIGRGTSTYDGLAIAWAVVEFLHQSRHRRPRTLFATHYHELTVLPEQLPRVRNYHVAVAEERGTLAFLYRILAGSADRSYGIHAAQVAGMPAKAVDRARRILADLEAGRAIHGAGSAQHRPVQLTLFDAAPDTTREKLRNVDIHTMTPLQALSLLAELVEEARRG